MHRNKSASTHQFAMTPQGDIPRSSFKQQHTHKTTFDAGNLVPIYVKEILPGDKINTRMTLFARMATPLFPVMDNLHLDSFFFFVPNRLVWDNWQKFMGEQDNPGDSISYSVPQVVSPAGGYPALSIYDYMGLPTAGQVTAGQTITHSALPMRAYNKIFNDWFRDENLVNSLPLPLGDGPDPQTNYVLRKRGKRHDYFTSALPWAQKGTPVSLPLGTTAPIKGGVNLVTNTGTEVQTLSSTAGSGTAFLTPNATTTHGLYARGQVGDMYADLSTATAATINQLRQAFTIQQLLEKDARGGTRYIELLRSHFGVTSPDARLQRAEYIGGGSAPININPIAQTSATNVTGSNTPMGNLAAMGTALAQGHSASYSAVEHGFIIGLVSVRADLTYQQGLNRFWSKQTRYDYYWPVFANLGEQTILNKEIYATGTATDDQVFGYQERWAEYRYDPSRISGLFKSTTAGTIDPWHLAQRFTSLPTLNQTFIEENPPLSRTLAVGAAANGQQLIADTFFDTNITRLMPMYSVPGLGKL